MKFEKFIRGYLFTSEYDKALNSCHLLDDWVQKRIGKFTLFIHPESEFYIYTYDNNTWLLVGNVIDPINEISDEKDILTALANDFRDDENLLFERLDCLTGRFVLISVNTSSGKGRIFHDAVGLKNVFYTETKNEVWCSSHSQLLADIQNYQIDPEIESLTNSYFYKIGVRHLPGLRTPYKEIRMLPANHCMYLPGNVLERYFPREAHEESDDLEKTAVVIGEVMQKSIDLLRSKKSVAVSLTFGTDSRVTFAASKNAGSAIHYFSYISNEEEKTDAFRASQMCRDLGVTHHIYDIPMDEITREDYFTEFCNYFDHNSAYIRKPKREELAKIYYLKKVFPDGFLEVKSHVSEIGRAFYCKKMGRNQMPKKLRPRHMSNLYKRNLTKRSILKFMDKTFGDFIETTNFGKNFYNYEEADMFYWEHRMPAWGSLANQDHDIIHDMTSLFNNRKILKLFLTPSMKFRRNDDLYKSVVAYLWPEAAAYPLGKPDKLKNKIKRTGEYLFFTLNRY